MRLTNDEAHKEASLSNCSSPQQPGSKGQKGPSAKQSAQPAAAEAPGPVDDWIAEGAKELQEYGVDHDFAVSDSALLHSQTDKQSEAHIHTCMHACMHARIHTLSPYTTCLANTAW